MFVDGDTRPAAGCAAVRRGASMGPSMFVDGDQMAMMLMAQQPKLRFNGAVDVRRRRPVRWSWSPTRLTALQWGRRCSSTETPIDYIKSRKISPASMGPSMFVDGDSPRLDLPIPGRAGFNGAVDVRRRRLFALRQQSRHG